MFSKKKRIYIIYLLSFLITLLLLYAGKTMLKNIKNQTMIAYARASARESDGTSNLVVLNGEAGSIADTRFRIRYLKDGYIEIGASNTSDSPVWKQLSIIELEPGMYTLSGLSGMSEGTVELLLSIEIDDKRREYYSQYNGDVKFKINEARNAKLYLHIYPLTEVLTVARPAIYGDAE